ncbi:AraC family transcriptional regulator [Paenibacillus sp. FSL R5-0517]|uniref:helix-turn-helix transcriptional regulator n=1 Tax=Paenibacillus sp. FSL R5-0517 TaxID=2921647 RepID=UPI0030DDDDD3
MGISQIQRQLEELKIHVTLVGNVLVPLDWRHEKHVTTNNCLYLFLEGEGTLKINNTFFHPQAGEAYILPAGSVISYSTSQTHPFRQMFCHFHAHIGEIPLFQMFDPVLRILLKDKQRAESLFSRLIEAFRRDDDWSPLAIKACMFELLSELWNTSATRPRMIAIRQQERINAIAQYMEDHIGRPLKIESLAAEFGYSPKYFFRYFKSVFGTTPHHYLSGLKMERAKSLLVTTEWSVEKIAEELDMERSHFSRMFLQFTEMTPARFRSWTQPSHID